MNDLRKTYKIEIYISQNTMQNRKKPYYWILLSDIKNQCNWCNEHGGWAETPQDAWEEAYQFYCCYKKEVFT